MQIESKLQLCNSKSIVKNVQGKLNGALSGSANWAPIRLDKLRFMNLKENFEYQEILDAVDHYNDVEEEDDDEEFEENEDDCYVRTYRKRENDLFRQKE